MITIGVDAHKSLHVALAVDATGRPLGQWRGSNSVEGWDGLRRWAAAQGEVRQWGIEGAWNYGRGLAQFLVGAGETVYEVNPRWTALGRRSARRSGKTDRLDAQAVALLVLREGAALPKVAAEDATAVLDLLVTEREGALAEATRLRSQIHSLLLQIDPEYKRHLPTLTSAKGLRAMLVFEDATTPLKQERAAAVRRTARRLQLALEQVEELAGHISARVVSTGLAPLTQLCGINLLTAAALAGVLGPGDRFATEAELAAYAGVAPLEASSAGQVRHRLNRGGNRRLNAILYRIALTQARHAPLAQAYLERRRAEGKTTREAFRALKRFLVRPIWRLWQACLRTDAVDTTGTGGTADAALA